MKGYVILVLGADEPKVYLGKVYRSYGEALSDYETLVSSDGGFYYGIREVEYSFL